MIHICTKSDSKSALKISPNSKKAYLLLGDCDFELGKIMDSKKSYQKALDLQPNDSNIEEKLSRLNKFINLREDTNKLIESHQFEKALSTCEDCLKLSSRDPECQLQKIKIFIGLKKYKEALQIMELR